jgi:hypothetical protein
MENSVEWIIVNADFFEDYENHLRSIPISIPYKLIFRPPSGIYDAMNFATTFADGTWLWFLNAGDYFLRPDSIAVALETISKNPNAHLLSFPVLYTTPLGKYFDVAIPQFEILDSKFAAKVNHQGTLIRRSSFIAIPGGFDTRLKFAADGKLLDLIASKNQNYISDAFLVGFVMGGASTKNFRKTVLETKSYRGTSENIHLLIYFKNYLRRILIYLEDRTCFRGLLSRYLACRKNLLMSKYDLPDI